jgi:predicted acetyltransferase
MSIEIRVPGEDDFTALTYADGRAFGFHYEDDEVPFARLIVDLDRFRVAVDTTLPTDGPDRGIIGTSGTFALDMTMPGGTTVPCGGVTWVGVASTHRRRGVLTQMMDALHADIDRRGEPIAALTASESGIYERFGYGVAARFRMRSIDTAAARLQDRFVAESAPIRFVEVDHPAIRELWERHRRTKAGEVSRDLGWHDYIAWDLRRDSGPFGKGFALLHPDGYVRYRVREEWNSGFPTHEMSIADIVALTPEAHAALWHTLLSTDLIRTITTRSAAEDDPLPYLLTNPRAMRTTNLNDGLWICLRDPAIAYGARTWGTDDSFVIEFSDGPFAGRRLGLTCSPAGGEARWVRSRPEMTATHAAMGALLLGGVRPSDLVAGRRLTARDADVMRRADAAFLVAPMPHLQTYF